MTDGRPPGRVPAFGWPDVVALVSHWPRVAPATSYGEPSLKVGRYLLTRHRVADDSLVLLDVPAEERETLIAGDPGTFFCEAHYLPYAIVLARLPRLDRAAALHFLDRRWRAVAGRRAVAERDAAPR